MKQENTLMENQNFRPFDLKKKMRLGESLIQALLFIAGIISIFTTVAIVYELGKEAWLFFGNPDVTFAKFFGTTEWSPGIGKYGIWPLVTSTLTTSLIAMSISLPLGLYPVWPRAEQVFHLFYKASVFPRLHPILF